MATATYIPVEEYLRTSYRPDRDYVDGQVEERNLGTRPHSALQGILSTIFNANSKAWGVIAFVELRVQVSRTRFRVPDVCVLSASDPADDIVIVPPMICIEVLSPEDTLRSVEDRAEDYTAMGVPHVWVFDPVRRRVSVATSNGLQRVHTDELAAEPPIVLSLPAIFTELDRLTGRG